MLVLGVNTKDKGTQLESLVHTELGSQGYLGVVSNFVGAGGMSSMLSVNVRSACLAHLT